MTSKILIIDDDPSILKLLQMHLTHEGYAVLTAGSGQEGLRLAREHEPDAVILDVRMPDMSGFEVCGRLRDISDAAVLFVTVLKRPEDIVRGLELGADDYVIKPFSYEELLARLQACLRRRAAQRLQALPGSTWASPWSIDPERRQVVQGEKRVQLTPKEFEVLELFLNHPDKVLAADEILRQLWGSGYVGDQDLVKQFVYRLRTKLENNPSEPRYLVTVRGAGYAFEPDTKPSIGRRPHAVPRPQTVVRAAPRPPADWQSPEYPYPNPFGIRARTHRLPQGLTIALALAIFLAGAAAAIAAATSLPGDVSYVLKQAAERVRVLASLSPEGDLELHLDHASSRAGELTQLVARGREAGIGRAADDYVWAVEQATASLDAVAAAGQPEAKDHAAMYTAKLLSNLSLLEGLRRMVPESSADQLTNAITVTHRGLDTSAELMNELRAP